MPDKTMLPHIEDMIKRYQTAQTNLINIIAKQEAKGNVTTYRKAVLANVNAELRSLNGYVDMWTDKVIPLAYENGADSSYAAFRKASIDIGKVQLNQAVIEDIVLQAREQFVTANAYIGRRIADEFRDVGMDIISNKVLTGSTVKEAQKLMVQRFADKGVSTITYRNGRVVQMDVYARLVARTTTAEATNKGAMNAVMDLGYDLVKMSQNLTTCEICAVYEGRVYSISGDSKDYPPLSEAFSSGYNNIHPSCTHRLLPYIPELDDNREENQAYSNRPFAVDEDKKAGIARYNEQQKANAQRARDRAEWIKAKTIAPDKTPATFSGYRAGKRANSKAYQDMQAAVKANKPTIPKATAPTKPKFIPATNVKEAEEYAKLFSNSTDYSKLTLDVANQVNEALTDLTSKYGIKIDKIGYRKNMTLYDNIAETKRQKTGIIVDGSVVGMRSEIELNINPAFFGNNKYQSILAEQYGRGWTYSETIKDIMTHETGHMLVKEEMMQETLLNSPFTNISKYGQSSRGESVAELFLKREKNGASSLTAEETTFLMRYIGI